MTVGLVLLCLVIGWVVVLALLLSWSQRQRQALAREAFRRRMQEAQQRNARTWTHRPWLVRDTPSANGQRQEEDAA